MWSKVRVVTMLWAGQLRNFTIPGMAKMFVPSPNAHNGCAPHPTPYSVGTGDSLPESKAVVALGRRIHVHLVPTGCVHRQSGCT